MILSLRPDHEQRQAPVEQRQKGRQAWQIQAWWFSSKASAKGSAKWSAKASKGGSSNKGGKGSSKGAGNPSSVKASNKASNKASVKMSNKASKPSKASAVKKAPEVDIAIHPSELLAQYNDSRPDARELRSRAAFSMLKIVASDCNLAHLHIFKNEEPVTFIKAWGLLAGTSWFDRAGMTVWDEPDGTKFVNTIAANIILNRKKTEALLEATGNFPDAHDALVRLVDLKTLFIDDIAYRFDTETILALLSMLDDRANVDGAEEVDMMAMILRIIYGARFQAVATARAFMRQLTEDVVKEAKKHFAGETADEDVRIVRAISDLSLSHKRVGDDDVLGTPDDPRILVLIESYDGTHLLFDNGGSQMRFEGGSVKLLGDFIERFAELIDSINGRRVIVTDSSVFATIM